MEIQREIWFKKCGISNQPDVCIFDDPCLSKFGALRGSCPHPGRQFVGLLCVSLAAPDNRWHKCHLYVEQNITARSRCLSRHLPYFQQQMPASFGSRGFILSVKRCHQGHQKVRPLSPVCRTCTRRIVQTWKRHGIRCKHLAGRNAHIFLQRISLCIFI